MRYALCVAFSLLLAARAEDSKSDPLRLWYSAPGSLWNDSMPIGNGRIGAMVRGVVSTELISLNEASIWSGTGMDRLNPDAYDSYRRIQKMLDQGDVTDASLEASLGIAGIPSSMREYMPAGDLQIVFQNQSGSAKNYERWLNLGDGTAGVSYSVNSVSYNREFLASNPSDVMAIRLSASAPGSLSFYIKFQRPSASQNRFAESSYAEGGDAIFSSFNSNQIGAVFGARVHIIGGSKRQIGDQIQVFGADEAWIYADIETTVSTKNPKGVVQQKLSQAIKSKYADIRDGHVNDYQALFDRVQLNLGTSTDEQKLLATGPRRQANKDSFDPELVALHFQFGRYLLISSSRPGGFPPNLQGIWNGDFNPAWGSKYTININLEMNYWPAEITNLDDLTEPLWSLLEKMHTSGKVTAQRMYQAGGWCAHHNTDIWGDTAPQDIWGSSTYWPMAHVWLLSHVYEHYRFTGDKKFLRKYYPLIYDAAQFVQDYLVDYNGFKVTSPSISPENSFINEDGITAALTFGPTVDNSLIWDLLGNLIEATEILKMPQTTLTRAARSLRDQLPPIKVSPSTGGIQEWIEDYRESEPGHRHVSHLWGFYPGHEITVANATLFDAVAQSVERRLQYGGGNTGWSRAWLMNIHARLYNGDAVEADIIQQLGNYTYDSLLGTGPPAAFQIDGNFGATAGIAEALLQSHNGNVIILPALPPSSKSGSFKGLVARGGFVVDASWENGQMTNATILSRLGNPLNLTVGTGQAISLAEAKSVATGGSLSIHTSPGTKYTIIGAVSKSL